MSPAIILQFLRKLWKGGLSSNTWPLVRLQDSFRSPKSHPRCGATNPESKSNRRAQTKRIRSQGSAFGFQLPRMTGCSLSAFLSRAPGLWSCIFEGLANSSKALLEEFTWFWCLGSWFIIMSFDPQKLFPACC